MRRVWTPVGSRVSAFLQSRAANVIERQRVIVYLLHVVLVVTVVSMQFLSMGGSQQALPLTMSGVHLFVCLVLFSLYLARKVTIPQALTLVTLVSQGCIAVRCYFFATTHSDPHYLQLILGNQVTTVLALFFLVMAFVKLTPFIIAAISLLVYGLTGALRLCAWRSAEAQCDEGVGREHNHASLGVDLDSSRAAQWAGD